jgi:hypothetical protein
MYFAQAPIDLNGATLGWGLGVLRQLANGLEGLMIGLEQYLVPYVRSFSLSMASLLFIFALMIALYSVASGKGGGASPMVGLFFKITIISVLLTGGAGAIGAGLPFNGQESKIVTAGGLQRREVAPGDNYTKIAWYVIDLFDALQTSASTGPLKGLYAARKSVPVCFVGPAAEASLPVNPQNIPNQDGQNPPVQIQQQGKADQVVSKCTRIDTTASNTDPRITNADNIAKQIKIAKGDINKKPKTPGEFARDVLIGAIPGVGAAGIVLNFAKDNIPQGLMVFIQVLEAPVIAGVTIVQRVLLIVYWAIIGPLAVGTIIITNEYIKKFCAQFIQINLWGIVGQFLISVISFLRLGIQVDPTNPSTSWLGVMFTLATFVLIIFTPKICSLSEGLASALGGFLVESGIAATAATILGGASAVGRGAVAASDKNAANSAIDYRAQELQTNAQNQFNNDPQGVLKQEYLQDVARGQTNQSVGDWISSKARAQAINEVQQTKRQNRELGIVQ